MQTKRMLCLEIPIPNIQEKKKSEIDKASYARIFIIVLFTSIMAKTWKLCKYPKKVIGEVNYGNLI